MAIISSGRFVSTGSNVDLFIRSDLDYLMVYNYTTAAVAGGLGCQFYWQRGMAAGTGLVYNHTAAVLALELDDLVVGGFTLFDTSITALGNPVATTASTNVVQPIVSTASTANLATGSVVVLSSIAAQPTLCGIPFEIDTVVANTSFRIRWPLQNVPGAVGGAGFYRQEVTPSQFAPRRRFIVDVNVNGINTDIITSVTHGYTVGELVRFYVPSAANAIVQLNNLQGTVIAVNTATNTFTVDIDSSAFTPFVFPGAAASPYTPAHCMAFASPASRNLSLLDDATRNEAAIGIRLPGGAGLPGGSANDVMYWVAGKSDQNFDTLPTINP